MAAEVGMKAPDFTLMNQDRQPMTLGREIGPSPIILAFFPAAFSSVCAKEMCAMRDSFGGGDLAGARVLGISVDTFWSLKVFATQEGLEFPLLSDFNKDVIRQYGVFNEDMIGLKGIAKRAVVLIDRAGVIRYREVLDDARNEPDYEKLRAAVRALHSA